MATKPVWEHGDDPVHIRLCISRTFHRLLVEEQVLGAKVWRIRTTNAKKGRTFFRTQRVTVPNWAISYGHAFAMAYMLHEAAHVVAAGLGDRGHGDGFRRTEDRLLAKYGIVQKRNPKSKNGYLESLESAAGAPLFSWKTGR